MIATVQIHTAVSNQRTFLKNVFFTPPFKVANVTEDKKAAALHLMLMSSSPGVLDGDQYQIQIDMEAYSNLQLFSQSYHRLYSMKQTAQQSTIVNMAAGSSFCYLPHPVVPHQQSSFCASTKIYLAANCSLIFGEILTCGRKLRGEIFSFSKYHAVTEIFFENRLVIKENLLIEPASVNLNTIGQLEGYTHQASLIFVNDQADIASVTDSLYELLAGQTEIMVGISTTPVNGLIVRILGQQAQQLHNCLTRIGALLNACVTNKSIHHV